MSEEMRKDTPEVGQWILLDGNSAHRFIRDDTGVWVLQHHTGMGGPYGVVAPRPWKPMTNPEEIRLRARVRELEEERRWRKWPEEKPEPNSTCFVKYQS